MTTNAYIQKLSEKYKEVAKRRVRLLRYQAELTAMEARLQILIEEESTWKAFVTNLEMASSRLDRAYSLLSEIINQPVEVE